MPKVKVIKVEEADGMLNVSLDIGVGMRLPFEGYLHDRQVNYREMYKEGTEFEMDERSIELAKKFQADNNKSLNTVLSMGVGQ